eukprot:scaffold158_cov388-Prasinococcus_capsulatus_cf.AAC.7
MATGSKGLAQIPSVAQTSRQRPGAVSLSAILGHSMPGHVVPKPILTPPQRHGVDNAQYAAAAATAHRESKYSSGTAVAQPRAIGDIRLLGAARGAEGLRCDGRPQSARRRHGTAAHQAEWKAQSHFPEPRL